MIDFIKLVIKFRFKTAKNIGVTVVQVAAAVKSLLFSKADKTHQSLTEWQSIVGRNKRSVSGEGFHGFDKFSARNASLMRGYLSFKNNL